MHVACRRVQGASFIRHSTDMSTSSLFLTVFFFFDGETSVALSEALFKVIAIEIRWKWGKSKSVTGAAVHFNMCVLKSNLFSEGDDQYFKFEL